MSERYRPTFQCRWCFSTWGRRLLIAALMLVSASAELASQTSPPTMQPTWSGTLEVGPTKLPLVFRLIENEGKTSVMFRSESQMPTEMPGTIEIKDKTLKLKVPALKAGFEGTLSDDKRSASGHWIQSGQKMPMQMKKSEAHAPVVNRPQHPKPPFPYQSEEVSFENTSAQIRLAGTLTLPQGKGPHPAVILVSGSGPQDRDETLFDHKPFLVIGDHLTRAGIAVLRYDDRGVGKSMPSKKPEADTSADLATDAVAAFDYLAQRPEIIPTAIGIIGHSEGGLIAPIVAGQRPVASIIFLAGPFMTGEAIMRYQLPRQFRALPENPRRLATAFVDKLMDTLVAIETGPVDPKLLRKLHDDYRQGLSAPDQAAFRELKDILINIGQLTSNPWGHYFIRYDPIPALKVVKCPILALFGEKDRQVPATENIARFRELMPAVPKIKTHVFPGLNHLFQTAQTGEPMEYGTIEQTIAPEVLEAMTAFLKKPSGS